MKDYGLTKEQIRFIKEKFILDLGTEVSFSEKKNSLMLEVHIGNISFKVYPFSGMIYSLDAVICFFDDKKFVYKNIDKFEKTAEKYYIEYPSLLEILNDK